MTYIRTKDRIFQAHDYNDICDYYSNRCGLSCFAYEVIAKSDNLFELFDEYIYQDRPTHWKVDEYESAKFTSYGAIWVIKNNVPMLKAVARNKGKGWELL